MFQTPEHWDKASERIDSVLDSDFTSFYTRKLIEYGDVKPHSHVLDVACGTGKVAYNIEKLYPEIDEIKGIDFSPKMIETAIGKKTTQYQNSRIEFLVMNGQDLKFTDDSFDNVFSQVGVLFYSDIPLGLKEIHRVLKDGGRAVISTWSYQFPYRVLSDAINTTLNKEKIVLPLSDPHEFEKLLKEAGFSSVQLQSVPHEYNAGNVEEYMDQLGYPPEIKENPELLQQVKQKIREGFNFESQAIIRSVVNFAVAIK
jgi:ubiquinone/menaquinone biosynthesis C-methylase UbiE